MVLRAESKRPNAASPTNAAAGDVTMSRLAGGLYLLATPIGHADDITLRGLKALRVADVLAAEDTRVLRQLMTIHGIPVGDRPMIAYHDHNAEQSRPRLLAALAAGQSVLYASDAGTPLIADPGYRLVTSAREAGFPVVALPGASAVLAALSIAALPTDRFLFAGFAPPKSAARRRFLEEFAPLKATLVFYESPHRVVETVADMAVVFGPRPAVLARELTKKFEESWHLPLDAMAARLATDGPPKGEIVLLVAPAPDSAPDADQAAALLRAALTRLSLKDAAREVAIQTGLPRQTVYAMGLQMQATDDQS